MTRRSVVRVSSGGRIRIPDVWAAEAGICDGDYVVLRTVEEGVSVEKLEL
jgi:bifunctional DNA-binding transcriptional regulator/antitoxin component of YhaV-PrlF toxin-antitoxin module